MEFRLANNQDLAQLKEIYKKIIQKMNKNDIQIWDDIYPCDFFENDIRNRQLYILLDNREIAAAFVLGKTNKGENSVEWEDIKAKSRYLDRLAVNVNYLNKGLGSLMIAKAKEIAREQGAEYLRLFVADINRPAIQLYEKNGFTRVKGVYKEIFDDGFLLYEHGYEVRL